MTHKNPVAPIYFSRFGTPRSSEAKVPTINKGESLVNLVKRPIMKTNFLGYEMKLTHRFFAWVAQLVEQGFCKPQVVGSNPIPSSRQETTER